MNLYHDSNKVQEIEDALVAKFHEQSEDRSNSVHLSDTGYCPMKTWCRLVGIKRLPFDRRSIGKMTIGNVGQTIIQQLYPEEYCEFEHPDFPSHADVMEDGKTPIEIKYTAQKIFRAADIPFGWRVQLMGYMALHNSPLGWLLIMNLFSGQWTTFRMEMIEPELEAHKEFLFTFSRILLEAGKEGNYKSVIPLVKNRFEVDADRFDKCKYCDYRPGRKRDKLGLGEGCPLYRKPLPI